ncbi:MAG: hypothetical protein IIC06_04940 [Proteobacteria bacterium]|nr:hypothetical protein [Pseudomonadota bacterium]
MVATLPRLAVLAAVLMILVASMTEPLAAEPVKPLADAECDDVRRGIEWSVPFGPGFRRLEFEFPKNDLGIGGKVCRLLTLGTGIHMESSKIRSLKDMRDHISGALRVLGWRETGQTARFTEKSTHGRAVFALSKAGNICVSTIVIGVVEGIEPDADAIRDGKIHLGALKPYQREWWISVDCFQVPVPEGADAPGAEAEPKTPDAPGAMTGMAAPDKEPAPETAPRK